MPEKYGSYAQLVPSVASTPIDTSTNIVFIGAAQIENVEGWANMDLINRPNENSKNDLDEKDIETQGEEQEKKVEELENDEGDAPADESDPGQLIYKGSILTISKDSEIIVFLAVMDTRCPTRNCLSDSRTGLLKNTMSSCSESDVVRYKSITNLSTRLVLLVSKKVTFLIVPSTLKKESCMLSS
jgi:hypothetical protein